MFIDSQTQLAAAQVVTATGNFTNTYDAGAPGAGTLEQDISIGQPLAVILAVISAAKVSATNETYEFDVVQSTVTALTSPDKLAQYAFTNAQAAALLTAGAVLVLPIPPGSITKEFLGVNAVLAGTSPTITVTAWIAPMNMVQLQRTYGTKIVVL